MLTNYEFTFTCSCRAGFYGGAFVTASPKILEGAPPFALSAKGGLFRSNATTPLNLFSFAGCPTRRFCAWVLGLPFLVLSSRPERPDLRFRAELWRVGPFFILSSRPEQRRLLPLRSGGIMARPNDSPSPVTPNKPSQETIVIPSEARNLLFLSSSRVDHMPPRSPIPCN